QNSAFPFPIFRAATTTYASSRIGSRHSTCQIFRRECAMGNNLLCSFVWVMIVSRCSLRLLPRNTEIKKHTKGSGPREPDSGSYRKSTPVQNCDAGPQASG